MFVTATLASLCLAGCDDSKPAANTTPEVKAPAAPVSPEEKAMVGKGKTPVPKKGPSTTTVD